MLLQEVDNRNTKSRVTERSRPVRPYKRREPLKRTYEEFFSNCQCHHGYSSQISYSFPDDFRATATEQRNEDWFPEE